MSLLRKIAIFLTCITIVFVSKAQQPVVPPQEDDLCTAINKVMKYSFNKFLDIQDDEQKTKIGFFSEYYWMTSYKIPGFTDDMIKLTITNKPYFSATYFRDADTQKAIEKYNELIEKVKSCVPKTCCEYSQSVGQDLPEIKRFEFWTTALKAGSDKRFEKIYITVNYIIETSTKEAVVTLTILPKE